MDTCVTAENIEEIERRAAYLEREFEVKTAPISIGIEFFMLTFKSGLPAKILVSDFLLYTEDILSLRVVDDSTVRSNRIRQTAINYTNNGYDRLYFQDTYTGDNYTISVVNSPKLIGFVNNKAEWSTVKPDSPCSSAYAIEFRYNTVDDVLPPDEEDAIIQQILFNLSDKYSRAFAVGT